MDYIEETLALVSYPAVVYEEDDHRLVAGNAAAWQWIIEELPIDFDSTDWRERSGYADILDRALTEGRATARTAWGTLHATGLAGGFELGRPSLVLTTLHEHEHEHAHMAHEALALAFRVSESHHRTVSALDSIATVASAQLQAQQRTMQTFTEAIGKFFIACGGVKKLDSPRT